MFAPDTPARESGGYPEPGAIQDVANHPDNSLPEPGMQPNMKHSTEMAGDVLPMPGEKSMGTGQGGDSLDYALGRKSSPGVKSIGDKTLGDWAKRTSDRLK